MTKTVSKEQYEEAIKILRGAPPKQAISHCCDKSGAHRYWPWRRRVETFLSKLDE